MPQETVLDRLVAELLYRTDDSALNKFAKRIDALKGRVSTLSNYTLAAGAALTTAAGGALKVFGNYEAGWSEMAAKTGEIADELEERYGSAVKAIARETGVSMLEVQRGFQKGLSAGLKGEDLINAVTEATRAQAAGIGSLEETLSSATTAWSVLGVDADAAMDIIAKAAQKGEGETADFGNSLKGLVGFTDTLKLDFEETAAALAAVSQNAKSVSVGETQLRGFFKAIADPSETAIKALEDLNASFDFEDLRKSMDEEGLAVTFGTMKTWIEDLAAAGHDTAPIIGALFPEVEAQQFFTTVDPSKIAELEKEMRLAAGTIQDAFLQGVEDVNRNWATMIQALKEAVMVIGEQLAPAFLEFTAIIRDAADWFIALDAGTQELIGQLALLGPAMIAVGVALKGLSLALGGLALLLGPAGLIVAGLAALGAALAATIYYWDDLSAGIASARVRFIEFMTEIGIPREIFSWIGDAWVTTLNLIASPVEGLWAWITEGENPFSVMTDRYLQFADVLMRPLVISFAWLVDAWGTAVDWVEGKWDGFVEMLLGILPDPFAALVEQAGRALAALTDIFGGGMLGMVLQVFDLLRTDWQTLIDFITSPFEISFSWLTDAWAGVMDWMRGQWSDFVGWMANLIPAPIRNLVERGQAVSAAGTNAGFGNEALEGLGPVASVASPSVSTPSPTASPRGLGGRGGARNVRVDVREVNIQAEGADAEALYGDASKKFTKELQNSFEGLDSPMLR